MLTDLKKIRNGKCITQKQIADFLGLGVTYISKVENGHLEPSFQTFYKWCCFIGLSTKELIDIWEDETDVNFRLFVANKQLVIAKKAINDAHYFLFKSNDESPLKQALSDIKELEK